MVIPSVTNHASVSAVQHRCLPRPGQYVVNDDTTTAVNEMSRNRERTFIVTCGIDHTAPPGTSRTP